VHYLSGTVTLVYLLPIDGSDHSQNSGVRRWVGIQADPSVNPGTIVIIIVLLTRTLPYFHIFWYRVVLGLRKPLLMPTLKPVPCLAISLLD